MPTRYLINTEHVININYHGPLRQLACVVYALPVLQFMTCVLRKFTRHGALENAVSMKYGDMNQNGGCYIIIA